LTGFSWTVSTPMMMLGGSAYSSHTGYYNDFPQGFTESCVRYAKTTRRSDTKRPLYVCRAASQSWSLQYTFGLHALKLSAGLARSTMQVILHAYPGRMHRYRANQRDANQHRGHCSVIPAKARECRCCISQQGRSCSPYRAARLAVRARSYR
jgi:hypothetical protein